MALLKEDNLGVFLRGCEEFGLKGSQLFDPGDLQDASTRPTAKGSDCTRKLKNVLITIYWLGRAANGCTSYSGPTLDLKEFEGLLSQMRKEAEETESPKRNIRDSGYIDCWDSERSDSLSPPRHCREDSFDSLDSFGSRSRQTPSPDVLVARGSSDGRGSDSESDGPPHRKMPDVRKDDMSVRRTSVTELRTPLPFNQYLPNKSNQSGYMPTPLRKKMNDKDEGGRKSWSTATSPVGGDRPCSLVPPSGESISPSHSQSCVPHVQLETVNHAKDSEGDQSASCTEIHAVGLRSTPTRSCSEELLQHSTPLAANDSASQDVITSDKTALAMGATLAAEEEESLTSPQCINTPSPSHFPAGSNGSAAADTSRQQGKAWSESEDLRGGASWTECGLRGTSVSMIDMRAEEETLLQPHSQVRHELMHNQYNKMKEEEDHWQDDLARWKNRRRSISQDLIKKEEERKMMEQLLSGDTCTSVRRRSIKTYREIVADKERREQELRDAYRRARTPEEASSVLQRYAQRFSISEAVLEQLQLPKLLDRSVSADPSCPCSPFALPVSSSSSPTTPDPFDTDPGGPLRYLRQQSAPAPKFTSTFEAQIQEFSKESSHQRPQIRSRSSEPPAARGLSPKAVPLLMPKPYLQSQPPASEQWPSKAGGLLPINGEMVGVNPPTSHGRESPPHFQASPSKHWTNNTESAPSATSPICSPHTPTEGETPASARAGKTHGRTETTDVQRSTPPSRPTTLPAEKYQREQEKLKEEWEKAQREVAEEERKYHEEERRILEESRMPLTPRSSGVPTSSRGEASSSSEPHDTIVRSLADWERKQELLERQLVNGWFLSLSSICSRGLIGGDVVGRPADCFFVFDWTPQRASTENAEHKQRTNDRTSDISTADDSMKTGRSSLSQSPCLSETLQNGQKAAPVSTKSSTPVKKPEPTIDGNKQIRPTETRRSVSGKKLCSSCGHPLGKGAAMIIETLSLYFHIHCFKCGVCKGQLGDTTTGTDVRIRNGLLNCHQCYIRSR
ncbi:unnamed protein product, partial [Tetraodon nigroviridis]